MGMGTMDKEQDLKELKDNLLVASNKKFFDSDGPNHFLFCTGMRIDSKRMLSDRKMEIISHELIFNIKKESYYYNMLYLHTPNRSFIKWTHITRPENVINALEKHWV
jgi:hypothetical protein